MLFNSYIFVLLFLPVAVGGYFLLNHFEKYKTAKLFVILMSFWFYGYFNYSYILIILFSVIFNFNIGKSLLKSENKIQRKVLLLSGLLVNLGLLFYFKYYNFFLENINYIFKTNYLFLNIVLPLGISFFTFQQISYVVDCFKKTVPKYNMLDYTLFVTFFPQLVAGPIVLHDEIIPQFEKQENKKVNFENLSKGLYAFTLGLAKKVLLADTFGLFVDFGYSNISILNSLDIGIVMLATTLQMYFDFSGYCDMATGIGFMFNIKLPMNFNSPYKAITIVDFWKRWHMTLTRFFTRYIYFPLGGNKKGQARSYFNIFIVFLVSGFWHGASWVFVLWGVMHGVFNIFTRIFMKYFEQIPKAINWIITFTFVNFSRLLFRAESFAQAKEIFAKLFEADYDRVSRGLRYIINDLDEVKFLFHIFDDSIFHIISTVVFAGLFIIPLICVVTLKNTNEKIENMKYTNLKALTIGFLLIWSVTSFSGVSTFLYFNF